MSKISWLLVNFLLLLGSISSVGLPLAAQPSLVTKQQVGLEALSVSFKRKLPPPRGSRGPLVCPIAPGILEQEFVIWSDRPLFLWQATKNQTDPSQDRPKTLEVLQADSPEHQAEILWKTSLSPAQPTVDYGAVQYQGQFLLQPGQKYQWKLSSKQEARKQQFQVMANPQRQQITADLAKIAAQLRAEQLGDEAIAIQQANYLVNRGLLSDALQVLYSLKKPSTEVTKTLQELMLAAGKIVCVSSNRLTQVVDQEVPC